MPRGPLLLLLAVTAWAAVASWNWLKPLPPGTHVASLATRLAESQVEVVSGGAEIEAHELAAIDRARELIILDQAPLSRAVGQGLLLQRIKRPNIKIVLVSDPRSEAYGGTPVEYLAALERAGVIVARVRLDRLRDCMPLYTALWRLAFGWWSEPFDESQGETSLRASLRARNAKADQRGVLVADDGARGWISLLPARSGGDLAMEISGGLARDVAASELEIASWSSGDDRLPRPPRTQPGSPGSVDARFLSEGAIRGAMLEALATAGSGDEIALTARRLSERRLIAALEVAAARGAHIRLLLDPGAPPNTAVAAELEREGATRIELRWLDTAAEGLESLALMERHGELWASAGTADFTRSSLDDIDLESAVELRLPARAEAARMLQAHFDGKWAAGTAYARHARESTADYWRYRFKEAAALAPF
jgi:hypothetical protein